jgi:hypothetical protein
MKLSTLILLVIALQFSLVLFSGNPATAHTNTAIFGFIQNPTNWNNTLFITLFGTTVALLAAGALVGSVFFKPDVVVFAGLVTSFISWCIPIFSLWQLIYDGTQSTFPDLGINAANGWIFASVATAPLAIVAIFTVIGWWRGNSEL